MLVTGAGGYIGTTLVPMLLAAGHRVRAVDRFFFGRELLADHERLDVIQADTRRLDARYVEGMDAVIDLVAISNDPSGELFQDATWGINFASRAHTAEMAKAAGVKRYILPSSCSIYGFQDTDVPCDETTPTNPLTTYARANEAAEQAILPLNDEEFCAVVLRQATVYGYSPRMRFDLAINGMVLGAWETGKLPLMRDGTQWRPMVHVRDTAAAQMFMLTAPRERVGGEIFNVGSAASTYQIGPLAELIAEVMPRRPVIEWYGDPDHRSYRVAFDKIESFGWRAERTAADGAQEILERLENGTLKRTTRTITLAWYQELLDWQKRLHALEIDGSLIDLPVAAE
ncbi:SDR family oxidoreductase [Marinivivus vitaminiproducens]|nr:SDR family oxidoreductase [Geminicoccaceae bacterium SCSIO 64248]